MRLIQETPPIYFLEELSLFPNIKDENFDELVAISLDLNTQRVIEAYKNGIFPWFMDNKLFFWFSPNPRTILYPKEIKISKTLQKKINSNKFIVKFNSNFQQVMKECQSIKRKDEKGSWITQEFINSYSKLHFMGYGHSVEVYLNDDLVGGLYGLIIGKCFFGESMFSKVSDASKIAFVSLAQKLQKNNFLFIDCQVSSAHLLKMGAVEVHRDFYLDLLKKAIN